MNGEKNSVSKRYLKIETGRLPVFASGVCLVSDSASTLFCVRMFIFWFGNYRLPLEMNSHLALTLVGRIFEGLLMKITY